jgi:glycerophosphoryl diester phosphodiesterase
MGRFYPFFESSVPLVFAHRGGAALAPENTMAAFDNANALGVDGLELDVRLASDGVVVVHHDRTLDRMTPLTGPLAGRSSAELAAVGVPMLSAVLDRYPALRLIVELKGRDSELARRTVDVVHAARAAERVCLASFSQPLLRHVRMLDRAIATSAAHAEVRWAVFRAWCRWPRWVMRRVAYAGFQVPEHAGGTRVVSQRFVAAAHAAGLPVQVWTVNEEADARRLLAWGVDALITDRPDVIVPVVRGFRRL